MYTDDKIKAAASIRTLSLALKISNDGVSWFKGTARGFECFRGCTNCGTIDNRERLWKKGRINWLDEMQVSRFLRWEIIGGRRSSYQIFFQTLNVFANALNGWFVVHQTSSKNHWEKKIIFSNLIDEILYTWDNSRVRKNNLNIYIYIYTLFCLTFI